jgi:hypothetical protein
MMNTPEPRASVRQSSLHQALKEVLAQQHYTGAVPVPPDYQTVVRRALEIEQASSGSLYPNARSGDSSQ